MTRFTNGRIEMKDLELRNLGDIDENLATFVKANHDDLRASLSGCTRGDWALVLLAWDETSPFRCFWFGEECVRSILGEEYCLRSTAMARPEWYESSARTYDEMARWYESPIESERREEERYGEHLLGVSNEEEMELAEQGWRRSQLARWRAERRESIRLSLARLNYLAARFDYWQGKADLRYEPDESARAHDDAQAALAAQSVYQLLSLQALSAIANQIADARALEASEVSANDNPQMLPLRREELETDPAYREAYDAAVKRCVLWATEMFRG